MKVVILEDEAPAREALEAALRRVAPSSELLATCASVSQATTWFRDNPAPDLVLADIQLSDGLSFELFTAPTCPVIFCTAFDEYAIEAMTAGGIAYLLKPIADADLANALERYRKLESHFAERVRDVAVKLAGRAAPRRLLARSRDGFVTLPLDQVAYVVVEDRLSEVVARDGRRLVLDRPLAELEAELAPAEFFRVNRQYLVAASAVRGFKPFVKGKLLVELEPAPASDVIVSQENAARFKAWLAS